MWKTMIVAYSRHCMGPMAVPPHHQTCSASQCKNLVQNEVFSHDLQCVEYGPRKLQKTQFSLVPWLYLDDSTQTKPPACPHGVGGCSPRCRIAWNGLHHPRESISAPIDVLEIWTYGGLGMEKRLNCSPIVLNDKEMWLKVPDGAMRPRPQKSPFPRRVFPRNGFEDIVCGIHPRELLRIEIMPTAVS